MAFLPSVYKSLVTFFVPSRSNAKSSSQKLSGIKHDPQLKRKHEPAPRRRKRSGSERTEEVVTKKRRTEHARHTPTLDGETFGITEIAYPQSSDLDRVGDRKPETDRTIMPPPSLTPLKARALTKKDHLSNNTSNVLQPDSASQTSFVTKSARPRHGDNVDEYDMERARRHAAATTLPANSGIWERGEKELFYHLAYRGFEPLLPASWMRDFPTLPLSLYATDDDHVPLIQTQQKRDFRAIRELRELLDLGKNVRDKVLSSPRANREIMIEKAVMKYISWALEDVGIKIPTLSKPTKKATSSTIPVHVIVVLQPHQSTIECLSELKNKLHALAARHRQSRNIYTSVEPGDADENSFNTETRLADCDKDDLPVLYGFMICRSILALFTMNSQTPPPKVAFPSHDTETTSAKSNGSTPTSDQVKLSQNILTPESKERGEIMDDPDDAASDPRFISDFDFSDPARDVWNALVIAIAAMQIRADMVMLRRSYGSHKKGHAELVSDEDDDPDA